MPPLPKQKLDALKRAFTEKAMSPGKAAQEAGVTYATAKRYYEKWSDVIQRSLEARLESRRVSKTAWKEAHERTTTRRVKVLVFRRRGSNMAEDQFV